MPATPGRAGGRARQGAAAQQQAAGRRHAGGCGQAGSSSRLAFASAMQVKSGYVRCTSGARPTDRPALRRRMMAVRPLNSCLSCVSMRASSANTSLTRASLPHLHRQQQASKHRGHPHPIHTMAGQSHRASGGCQRAPNGGRGRWRCCRGGRGGRGGQGMPPPQAWLRGERIPAACGAVPKGNSGGPDADDRGAHHAGGRRPSCVERHIYPPQHTLARHTSLTVKGMLVRPAWPRPGLAAWAAPTCCCRCAAHQGTPRQSDGLRPQQPPRAPVPPLKPQLLQLLLPGLRCHCHCRPRPAHWRPAWRRRRRLRCPSRCAAAPVSEHPGGVAQAWGRKQTPRLRLSPRLRLRPRRWRCRLRSLCARCP